MYCDANGHPDPRGDYSMIDGKITRRMMQPGEHVGFDMAFMDSAARAGHVFLTDATTFNDAERQFADSAEGQFVVAQARTSHARKNRYLGDSARDFTEAMAANAVRAAVAQKAGTQSLLDRAAADEPRLRAEADAARRSRFLR